MSDFDQFESAPKPDTDAAVEEDPAAAFLAREQDDLAALEGDDFVSSEPAAGAAADSAVGPATDTATDFGADAFGSEEPTTMPTDTGAADADIFDPLGDSAPDIHVDQDFGAQDQGEFGETGDMYTAIKQVDTQRADPEKIRIWREEQKEILIKKDAESEEKKEQWREIAKKELEDWYKHRAEQLEKAKKNNIEGEAAFIQERDENIPGHEWERICRHCDFNPKSCRTNKDASRMRSILLQLKQTPLQRA